MKWIIIQSDYTGKDMKIVYNPNGIGITELTALSFYHPFWFLVVSFLIDRNLPQIALKIARLIV